MGGLIWLIIVVVIFYRIGKKSPKVMEQMQEAKDEVMQAMQTPQEKKTQNRGMTDADRQKLEAYRRWTAEKAASKVKPKAAEMTPKAKEKVAETNDIVSRAKANSARYADKDETLTELEREHKHSEHVTPAGSKHADREETKYAHTSAAEPKYSLEESLLPSVEDLMVKGYEGNLSFERDFLGEAMDMLSSYTL